MKKLRENIFEYNYSNNINNNSMIIIFRDYKYNKKVIKSLNNKQKRKYVKYTFYVDNYNEELLDCLEAINIQNTKEKYTYIYDKVCAQLDKKWDKYSPCKFCNEKCIASRNNAFQDKINGCCYSFPKRTLFRKVEKSPCKYLGDNKKCLDKNISCKLFTCDYLKRNTKFNTSYNDYLLLTCFFNSKRKLIIKYNFFRKEEEIINKLLEPIYLPYVIYILSFKYSISNCVSR